MTCRTGHREILGLLFFAVSILTFVGCGPTDPPEFRLNMPLLVNNQITDTKQQKALASTLDGLFGTPDKPFVLKDTGLNINLLKIAAGPVRDDAKGQGGGLYRRHCVHCHGISGDGQGPTAKLLNPYPRDYRPGIYKFKSTLRNAPPTDKDLLQVLNEGIPGTAMPSFALLGDQEKAALIEYVKYLSMRGQTERELVDYINSDIDAEAGDIFDPSVKGSEQAATIRELMLENVAEQWLTVNENIVVPAEETLPVENRSLETITLSAAKGRKLFFGTDANCFSCHGPTALGDGQQTDHDDWTKTLNHEFRLKTAALVDSIADSKKSLSSITSAEERKSQQEEIVAKQNELRHRRLAINHMLPVRNAIPRNLRAGVFRGGRRPIDIFWRINSGINGTPMPGAGTGDGGPLTEAQIWNLVDYIKSLEYEATSQPQVKLPENTDAVK